MTTIHKDARQVLVDLFSRRGRLSAERFRTAYLTSLAMMIVINALSLLASGSLSSITGFFGVFLAFFVGANVATKRHRDTRPLQIPLPYPLRVFSSNPFANQSGPSGSCAIGLAVMAFSLLAMRHSGHSNLTLQFCAFSFFVASAAALATRYFWVAPPYPNTNQYGPNPHEVPQ